MVPPKIHDIARLFSLVREHTDVPTSLEPASGLTVFSVVTRYPADLGEVDGAEWADCVARARAVVAWAAAEVGA